MKQLSEVMENVKKCYNQIEQNTGVALHSIQGLTNFQNKIQEELSVFMDFSRKKAKEAQSREQKTQQPKEFLSSLTKATITIQNYLGGQYFLTTDEVKIENETVFLIESKHSKNGLLPSKSDIKDGLIKMILYCNLESLTINNQPFISKPVLQLTSSKVIGEITNNSSVLEIEKFISQNKFSIKNKETIFALFQEANQNGFEIIIKNL